MALRPIPRPKVPRVGRPKAKFSQSRRFDHLRAALEAHPDGLTLDDMAAMLHVTTRTVRRYLPELAILTDLEPIPAREGGQSVWRIKPSERGRKVPLRRTQAYGLLATRRIFDVLKGSALYDEIDVALRQVEQIAHLPASRTTLRGEAPSDGRLEDRFAFVPPVPRTYANRSEDVDELFQAVAELRVLRFRYSKDARGTRIRSHPYALVLHAGSIACVARDLDQGATRVFILDAMSELSAEAERFELPPDFQIADWLHGDFGVARAPRTVKLLVEFDQRAADAVRARRIHPSQKVAVAADGRVRVSMSVPESADVLSEVRRWLLGFGAEARVIEPRDLADSIAHELRRAASRYEA